MLAFSKAQFIWSKTKELHKLLFISNAIIPVAFDILMVIQKNTLGVFEVYFALFWSGILITFLLNAFGIYKYREHKNLFYLLMILNLAGIILFTGNAFITGVPHIAFVTESIYMLITQSYDPIYYPTP